MKKLFVLLIVAFSLCSCGMTSSLYYWGGVQNGATTYENLAYKNYDKQTPESICKLICMYEEIVANPGGTRKMPPPGICAEYGYLLLIPENAAIFADFLGADDGGKAVLNIELCLGKITPTLDLPKRVERQGLLVMKDMQFT